MLTGGLAHKYISLDFLRSWEVRGTDSPDIKNRSDEIIHSIF